MMDSCCCFYTVSYCYDKPVPINRFRFGFAVTPSKVSSQRMSVDMIDNSIEDDLDYTIYKPEQ